MSRSRNNTKECFLLLASIFLIAHTTCFNRMTGWYHNCIQSSDNRDIQCWGVGSGGRLGYENMNSLGDDVWEMSTNLSSVNVGDIDALMVSSGGSHTCSLFTTNDAKCWGSNTNGQLGFKEISCFHFSFLS